MDLRNGLLVTGWAFIVLGVISFVFFGVEGIELIQSAEEGLFEEATIEAGWTIIGYGFGILLSLFFFGLVLLSLDVIIKNTTSTTSVKKVVAINNSKSQNYADVKIVKHQEKVLKNNYMFEGIKMAIYKMNESNLLFWALITGLSFITISLLVAIIFNIDIYNSF